MINSQDKYIISEFHGFEVDRKALNEAIQTNSTISIKCILQKADTLNRNGRVYPFGILKRETDKYLELVKDRSAMGECVPAGTQIFTTNGWKNIEDVKIGENIFTLNIASGSLEVQSVNNTIKKHYNDDLIHIYNSHLDMKITKKHKVVLWNRYNKPFIVTGQELYDGITNNDSKITHSHIKHTGNWIGEEPKYFTLPNSNIKIRTEDWAAFLGIYISEGHASGSKGGKNTFNIGITQTKFAQKELIRELLNKLPFSYSEPNDRQFIIHSKDLHAHLIELGNSNQKHIPSYAKNWSPALLNILLDWLLIGDGRNRHDRHNNLIKEYCTISNKLTDDVLEIMLKCNNGATVSTIIPKDRFISDTTFIEKEIDINGELQLIQEKIITQRLIKAENSQPINTIHARTTKGIYLDTRFTKAELISHNDNVYCVTVPNGTWLMKSDNKISWTHNCDHPDSAVISLSNVSHLVTEMWWEGPVLYGKIEIADTPSGNIVKGLLKSGIKLGISSRGVGSVKSRSGQDVVQEDFELIGFDIVSSPSTPGAYLFKEGRQWGMKKLTTEDMIPLKSDNIIARFNDIYKNLIDLSNEDFWKI